MEEYSVYMHTNKINGKKYIGITKQKPEQRWGSNGNNYNNKCPHFYSAIQNYGWENFEHEVIVSGISKEEACAKEIELIAKYKSNDREFGYNILEGGTAPSLPEEVRHRMSISMMGNQNGLGKKCSEEKKKKISDAQKGRHLTEEHKQKLSDAKRGKSHAPPSEETKRKISASHKKKSVLCETTGKIYESIQACARETGVKATTVCACCKGKIKTIYGLTFKYYQDNTIKA